MQVEWVTGLVTEWKPGWVKVTLPTYDDIVTDWLQIMKPVAMKDDFNVALAVNEQVQCLVDCECKNGLCLGATSNDVDKPDAGAGAGKMRIKFEDGTVLEYDKAAHKLTANMTNAGSELSVSVGSDIILDAKNGKLNVTFGDGGVLEYDKATGKFKIGSGGGESVYKLLKDFLTGITLLTVPTPAGNSSVPINVATFNTLLTRLDTLLQ